MSHYPQKKQESRFSLWIAFGGFLAIAGYFLWTEHRAHLIGALYWLPWLLLLLCPLMHIFMHGGHGKTSHGKFSDSNPASLKGGTKNEP